MKLKKVSRRNFIKLSALTTASLAVHKKNSLIPIQAQSILNSQTKPDVEFTLTAKQSTTEIFPNINTNSWAYQADLLKGPSSTLTTIPNSYLGPIINLNKNDTVRIHFKNELPESSIIHWHGLHVPVEADGHPRLAIDSGQTYTYTFKVLDRASTYWYHPHPHGRTAHQVYHGLAGLLIIHDEEEKQFNLPQDEYDLPIVIQDRRFDQNGQFLYGNSMMDNMTGFLGNTLLINGTTQNTIDVKTHPYRLRLLNGSNSRIYKIAWQDNSPITVIATDGGLLEEPIQKQYITLAPAQRIDIWADFSQSKVGTKKTLINLPFETYGGESSYTILTANINEKITPQLSLPKKFSTHATLQPLSTKPSREFDLEMSGMIWNLNGKTFEMQNVAPNEIVNLGDTEIWQFNNIASSGMGMMGAMNIPHPMHVHGLQFKILDRNISNASKQVWESLKDGFIDQGWHDTVLVMPGEKVKIALKFEDFTGLYLYHCHNLEHEDMGMMRNYRVDK